MEVSSKHSQLSTRAHYVCSILFSPLLTVSHYQIGGHGLCELVIINFSKQRCWMQSESPCGGCRYLLVQENFIKVLLRTTVLIPLSPKMQEVTSVTSKAVGVGLCEFCLAHFKSVQHFVDLI